MKKVFAYIGSRNTKSNTVAIVREMEKYLNLQYPSEFLFDVMTPNDFHLLPCRGCNKCFDTGQCQIDQEKVDEGIELKQRIEEADAVILASPVYFHNVSSDMKCLMDRLTYWCHLFKLAAKPGVLIAHADSNGTEVVNQILQTFCDHLGINVAGRLLVNAYEGMDRNKLKQVCERLNKFVQREEKPVANQAMERIFLGLKWTYSQAPDHHAERKYWERQGLFNYQNLNDYLNHIVYH